MTLTVEQANAELAGITTIDGLRQLISRIDASGGGGLTVFYSGEDIAGAGYNEIAASLAVQNSSIQILNDTEAAKFLDFESNHPFRSALERIVGGRPDLQGTPSNIFLNGETDSYGNRVSTGIWDEVSARFAAETVGKVRVLTSLKAVDRVFTLSELPILLENERITTIDGIPREHLLSLMHSQGLDYAKHAVSANAFAHIQLSGLLEGDLDGYLNFQLDSLPAALEDPIARQRLLSVLQNANDPELIVNLESGVSALRQGGEIAHVNGVSRVLNRMGVVGGLLSFMLMANEAAAAESAEQAEEIVKQWAVETAGGELGSLIAGAAAGIAVAAIATVSAPISFALMLGASLIGGFVGGDWATEFYGLIGGKDEANRRKMLDRLREVYFGEATTIPAEWIPSTDNNFLPIDAAATAQSLVAAAKANIAWRYALQNLNPFVVPDAPYDELHNKAGELDLFDPAVRRGLTDEYLLARAEALRTELALFDGNEWAVSGQPFPAGYEQPYADAAQLTGVGEKGAVVELHLVDGFKDQMLFGARGSDVLRGAAGDDQLFGAEGDDLLEGRGGGDYLEGGEGTDTYVAGHGDTIFDHDGKGRVWFENQLLTGGSREQGAEVYRDAAGHEYVLGDGVLRVSRQGQLLSIAGFRNGDLGIWLVEADGIEVAYNVVVGSEGDDNGESDAGSVLTGTDQADQISALGGSDRANAGLGDDWVEGGDDSDILVGGEGADVLHATHAAEQDSIEAGLGAAETRDWLSGQAGDDRLYGSHGADGLAGGAGNDLVFAGAGDDHVWGDSQRVAASFAWQDADGVILTDDAALHPAASGHDVIHAGAGDDRVWGQAGDDVLYGEAGHDLLSGDYVGAPELPGQYHGDDLLDGGDGDDGLTGDGGSDLLFGGAGDDYLNGDNDLALLGYADHGDDLLDGGSGDDILIGAGGADTLLGGDGADVVRGDLGGMEVQFHGADLLDGGGGDDELLGDGGDDRLYGGAGADELDGDSGDLEGAAHGDDYLDGGAGDDRLIGNGGRDQLYGGGGHDVLVGDASDLDAAYHAADELHGGRGNDQLIGGGAGDRLYGDAGIDRLWGDASDLDPAWHGDDVLDGGAGDDQLIGGGGADRLLGGSGWDRLFGDADELDAAYHGRDRLDGGDGNDLLVGHGAADVLLGGAGDDALHGDGAQAAQAYHGDDELDGGAGNDRLWGDGGNDRLSGGIGDDQLAGGAGDDLLKGDAGHDTLSGGAGRDELRGGTGQDALYGDAGDDWLLGEAGDDRLIGGAGVDVLDGGAGADLLQGGEGDDTVAGGTGDDVFHFRLGDGQDQIADAGGFDVLRLSDVSYEQVQLDADDAVLHVALTAQDGVSIDSWRERTPIDAVVFQDGRVLNLQDGRLTAPNGWYFDAADETGSALAGTAGDDVFDIGAAGDADGLLQLAGGAGNDTYVIKDAVREYRVTDTAGHDTLAFAEGVSFSDLVINQDGDTLSVDAGAARIRVENWSQGAVERFRFADGTVVELDAIQAARNHAPVAVGLLPTQTATEQDPFTYVLPAGLFQDPDGDPLRISVATRDGAPLPGWLHFDADTPSLRGTPGSGDVGALALIVTAADKGGLTANAELLLTIANVNDPPLLQRPLHGREVSAGYGFSFTLPADAWSDSDPGDTLTYQAELADGERLPAWLTFDSEQRRFVGVPGPAQAGSYAIRVSAQDAAGEHAEGLFELRVRPPLERWSAGAVTLYETGPELPMWVDFSAMQLLGDVNGDGFSDYSFSVEEGDFLNPPADLEGPRRSAQIVYGDAYGWGIGVAKTTLALLPESAGEAAADTKLHAVGDVDGDGYDDVVVQGKLLPGAPQGLGETLSAAALAAASTAPAAVLDAIATGGGSGRWLDRRGPVFSVSLEGLTAEAGSTNLGDINGDGKDDFLLNAVRAAQPHPYVLYGGIDPSADVIDLAALDPASGFAIAGLPSGYAYSYASGTEVRDVHVNVRGLDFSGGDLDGDGYSDILLSASVEENHYSQQTGNRVHTTSWLRNHVLFGAATEDLGGIDLDTLAPERGLLQSLAVDTGNLYPAAELRGDINGDGYADAVVSYGDSAGYGGSLAALILYGADIRNGTLYSGAASAERVATSEDGVVYTAGGDDWIEVLAEARLAQVHAGPGDDRIEVVRRPDDETDSLLSLHGGAGSDTYVFNGVVGAAGGGVRATHVVHISDPSGGGANRLLLDSSFEAARPILGLGSLRIDLGDTGWQLHLESLDPQQVLEGPRDLGGIEWADGTVLSYEQLVAMGFDLPGTANADQIHGTSVTDRIDAGGGDDLVFAGRGDDVIAGGEGNDVLDGGPGNDLYRYAPGDGNDVLRDADGEDRLVLAEGLARPDLGVERHGEDLVLRWTEGSVRLEQWFRPSGTQLERVEFADGSYLTAVELEALAAQEVLVTAIPDQTATEDEAFVFALPPDSFIDPGAGELTLTAIQSAGAPLPAWLSFNPDTWQLSGTPANADVGELDVLVTAVSARGLTASDQFRLSIANVNDAPTVAGALEHWVIEEGRASALPVPANLFVDPDSGDSLQLSLNGAGGAPVPGWLRYDEHSGELLASPDLDSAGDYRLQVKATDLAGASVSTPLVVSVRNLIEGGDGLDFLRGTPGADVMRGHAGLNWMLAGDGDDTLVGGADADYLFGGAGDDLILGGKGNDYLFDLSGDNRLDGGAGDDVLIGGDGDDTLVGGDGRDQLKGGLGDDVYVIRRGSGQQHVFDLGGNDRLRFADVSLDELTVVRQDQSLLFEIAGANQQVFAASALSDARRIERIETLEGAYIYDERLDQLVAAMTVFGAEGSALQSGVPAPPEETMESYLTASV